MFDSSMIGRSSTSDSPSALQSACLDFICENLEAIAVVGSEEAGTPVRERPLPAHTAVVEAQPLDFFRPHPQNPHCTRLPVLRPLSFPALDVFLHTELSEQLLARLCVRGKMNDGVMGLFKSSQTRLRKVEITEASKLTTRSLRVLKGHRITHLTTIGLAQATVTDLIGCLSDWSLANLQALNVAKSTFVDHSKITVVVALSKLHTLHTLNVAGTEFSKSSLDMVVHDLPLLEHLDISCTKVNDITCLRRCKSRLKSLSLYGLKFQPASYCQEDVHDILPDLHELRHLDVSENPDNDDVLHIFTSQVRVQGERIFRMTTSWPHLVSLDMSGHHNISDQEMLKFLKGRENSLRFLGLALSETCKLDMLSCELHGDYNPHLQVTGNGDERQVMESLRRYRGRPFYVQKTLYHMFRLTQGFTEARRDMIELVTECARTYRTVFNIQMAATACLFNLTKGDLGKILHPKILSEIVEVNLNAMEEFPQHQQLQKNVLLTICSDRILQDVSFDRFRCAKLVVDCLCKWNDVSMNRMSVAICSILAAKISTKETSELGSHPNYMEKLLQMVQERLQNLEIDIILKFTLSALWNLTDESPKTCQVFLQEGGMTLFLKVLDTFPGEISIETKVLGLLNNIAEVKELRSNLMVNSFINLLSKLMHSMHIDVSYFATGIVAYLASSGPWTVTSISQQEITEDLCRVVSGWKTPKDEMVAYRSFKPFFPLMAVDQHFAVQLWAAWAIHHVCSKNPQRYCPMLQEQGGGDVILDLLRSTDLHSRVYILAESIIMELIDSGCISPELLSNIEISKDDHSPQSGGHDLHDYAMAPDDLRRAEGSPNTPDEQSPPSTISPVD